MYYIMFACVVVSSIMFLLWIVFFIKYRHKFDGMLDNADSKIFTLKSIYFIGLGFIENYEKVKNKRITTGEKAVEKIRHLSEVFGRESAEMYYYISVGAKISLVMTFVPIGLLMTCILKSLLGFLIGILLAFILPYGIQMSINGSVTRKKDAIISEFPKMVSKLTMLINAGMLVRRAWEEVASSNYEEPLYAEMRTTSKDMLEGMDVEEAMNSFASRCGLKEIRKFSSIFVQAVNRGASESIDSMKIMADEAWEQKKQISKQKGETASQKLMVPNLIMFLGILAVVVVPMFSSMFSNL